MEQYFKTSLRDMKSKLVEKVAKSVISIQQEWRNCAKIRTVRFYLAETCLNFEVVIKETSRRRTIRQRCNVINEHAIKRRQW